jgi:hypothetical protein
MSWVQEVFTWAQADPQVRVKSRPVPETICSEGATLHELQVQAQKFKGPSEDEIYAVRDDIRERIARGNVLLEFNASKELHFVLRGMWKFTGRQDFDEDPDEDAQQDDEKEGADDHVDSEWKKFFLDDMNSSDQFIRMEKANGEACHLACQEIHSVRYLFCGSKNTHVMLREGHAYEDLETYHQASFAGEISFALRVAKLVLDTLFHKLSDKQRSDFLNFLQERNLTANFESIFADNQHIVEYELKGSDEKKEAPAMAKFYACSAPALDREKFGLCYDPVATLQKAREEFGLQTVEYQVSSISDFDAAIKSIRSEYNSEGCVVYFLKAGRTIGLLKIKSEWYVLVRAFRQKILRWNIGDLLKRIDDISKWLIMDAASLSLWKKKAAGFVRYLRAQVSDGKLQWEDLDNQYAQVWAQFEKQFDPNAFTEEQDRVELSTIRFVIAFAHSTGDVSQIVENLVSKYDVTVFNRGKLPLNKFIQGVKYQARLKDVTVIAENFSKPDDARDFRKKFRSRKLEKIIWVSDDKSPGDKKLYWLTITKKDAAGQIMGYIQSKREDNN